MATHIRKIPFKYRFYRQKCFFLQRLCTKTEAAVVIQNVQRMAADAVGKGEISFEIRLPHDIGLLLFKALDMGCSLTCFLADEMVACEDVVERSHAGQVFVPHVFHDLMELFCAQRRILPA